MNTVLKDKQRESGQTLAWLLYLTESCCSKARSADYMNGTVKSGSLSICVNKGLLAYNHDY